MPGYLRNFKECPSGRVILFGADGVVGGVKMGITLCLEYRNSLHGYFLVQLMKSGE